METPKLNYILFSEEAIVSKVDKLSLVNIFENITSKNFPALHYKLCVTVNFEMTDKLPHKFKIQILNNEGKVVITSGENTFQLPHEKKKVQIINTFMNIEFEEEGEYSVVCYIDGTKMWDKQLSLKKTQ